MSHFVGKCTTELNFSIENLQLFVTTLQVFAPPSLHDTTPLKYVCTKQCTVLILYNAAVAK